jgi:predicted aspartyl protease
MEVGYMWTRSFSRDASAIVLDAIVKGPHGSRRMQLLLDTGASITLLPREVVEGIGYTIDEDAPLLKLDTVSGSIHSPVLKVRELSIFGVEAPDIDIICHDLPMKEGLMGLLGLNFFRNLELTLDFRLGKITIE